MPNKIDDDFFHKQMGSLEKEMQRLMECLNELCEEEKEVLKKAPHFTNEDEIRLSNLRNEIHQRHAEIARIVVQ